MTKKTDIALMEEAAVALEKQKAELAKIRPLARGERLRQAEASLKPKTRRGRLIQSEREVEASAPTDARCIYADMKPAKREPSKPDAKAALARTAERVRRRR